MTAKEFAEKLRDAANKIESSGIDGWTSIDIYHHYGTTELATKFAAIFSPVVEQSSHGNEWLEHREDAVDFTMFKEMP